MQSLNLHTNQVVAYTQFIINHNIPGSDIIITLFKVVMGFLPFFEQNQLFKS